MKYLHISFIYLIGLLFFTSCDDFLDNDPKGSLPEDEAFESLADCERALNGAYRSMYNYIVSMPALYDVAVDDIKYTRWGDNSYDKIRVFSWSASSFGETSSPWGINYTLVARVNNLLKGIEKFEGTTDPDEQIQIQHIKGEAYMFRAFAHFELLRTYGYRYNSATATTDKGVPIVFETNLKDKPRETVSNSLTLILQDLEKAKTSMTAAQSYMNSRSTAIYYFSLNALYALETRIHLYQEDYQKVIQAANNISGYELTDEQSTFTSIWANDLPQKEVIFMIGISTAEVSSSFSLAEYLYLRDKSTKPYSRANFIPATEIMDLYDKVNDIRWGAYFTENYPMHSSTTDNGETLTLVTKYPGNATLSTSDKINQTKYFRYAEVVLNKIEALYYVNEQQALAELNAFRKKRITGHVDQTYTGQELLAEIKLERRKEFAFEGMRFHDLRRWNQGFERQPQKYIQPGEIISVSSTDHHWLYPVPQHEMNANSLPKDYQNPGY